jgi:hypothetical protein
MEGIALTKEALSSLMKGIQFFKYKKIGLNVIKGNSQVFLQVRESRYHEYHESKGKLGHSWHDIREEDFLHNKANFYVFVTHLTDFETTALVVPRKDLERLLEHKQKGQNGVYRFYFHFNGKDVTECRDQLTDYSEYFNRWNLIKLALES